MNSPIIHNKELSEKIHRAIINTESNKSKFKGRDFGFSIIAFHNMDKPLLERNLDFLGIDYETVNPNTDYYYHTMKVEYLYEYLKENKSPDDIVLICDCDDVIIQKDPKLILDVFESYDCKILFMSTTFNYPYHCMPENQKFVNNINNNSGRYLNAGVYIGYVKDIIELYEEALKYIPQNKDDLLGVEEYKKLRQNPNKDIKDVLKEFPKGSHDQDIFRYLEPKFYPRLKVDYTNKLAYRI